MSGSNAALKATLGLDTAQFESRARAAGKSARELGDGMRASFERARQAAFGSTAGFEALRASIDPAFAASRKYAQIQAEVAGYVEAGTVSQRAANLVLEQAASKYMGVETAAQAASRAQRESEASISAAARGYQSLLASVNPVYAASKQYEAAQEAVNAALREGIVTQGEANRTLDLAAKKFLAADVPAAALVKSTGAVGSGARNLAPLVQNAAFQIGDMAVQVAGGTSAMRAMSMQVPQLLGGFGMWGAVIGGVVAVAAALAPELLDSGDAAKGTSDAVNDLASASSAYAQAAENARKTAAQLRGEFGSNADAAARLYDVMKAIAILDFAQKMNATISSVSATFDGLKEKVDAVAYAGTLLNGALRADGIVILNQQMAALKSEFGLTAGQAERVSSAVDALGAAKGAQQQATAAEALANELLRAYQNGANIPPNMIDTARQVAEAARQGYLLGGALDGSANAASAAAANADGLTGSLGNAAVAAQQLAAFMNAVPGAISQMQSDIAGATAGMKAIAGGADAMGAAVAKYRGELEASVPNLNALEDRQASVVGNAIERQVALKAEQLRTNAAYNSAVTALNRVGSAGSSSGKKVKDGLSDAQKEAERLAQSLQDNVVQSISSAVGSAVDWMLDGFKGGFSGLLDIAKNALKQIISLYATNRISLSLGLGVTGVAGAASAGALGTAASAAGSAGFLGSLGLSGLVSGLAAGFKASLGLGGFTSAGLFNVGANAALASAATGASALVSTLGALAAPLAAVAAVFSFFSTKTKLLDAGLKITVKDFDTLVQTYKKVKKTSMWGLISSTKTTAKDASAEVADPITKAVAKIQNGIVDTAKLLGVGATVFKDFSASVKFSTKGLSDTEIATKLQEKLVSLGDSFAGMIPTLKSYALEDEGLATTLTRLGASATATNGIMDTLGMSFRATGLATAAMAADLAGLFGGLDAMGSATSAYYQAFYSDAERVAISTRQLTESLAAVGIVLPKTREAYRALADAQDLSTEAGRKLWAQLINLAPTFDQIAQAADVITGERLGLEKQLLELQGDTAELRRRELEALDPTNRALQVMIWGLQDAQKAIAALDVKDFATLYDFNKATGLARNGSSGSYTAPDGTVIYQLNATAPVATDQATVIELRAVRAQLADLQDQQRQLGMQTEANTRKAADTLRKFDVDGMPAVRA